MKKSMMLLFFSVGLLTANGQVDAVSSASGDIKITGGKVYDDSVVLETYHKDSYLHHWIGFGLSDQLGDTIIVSDTPRVGTGVIRNLIRDTLYYFKYAGDNPANSAESHSVSGKFRTVSVSSVVSDHTKKGPAGITLRQNELVFSRNLQCGDLVFIRDVRGRVLFSALAAESGNAITLPSPAKGVLLVQVVHNGLTVLSELVLFL